MAAFPRRGRGVAAPLLVSSLNARVGAVLRLGARDWDDIPRRFTLGGHVVRVGRFVDVNHKIIVTRGPQDHIMLLVIPPEASTASAKAALAMAATGRREEILAAVGIDNEAGANTPRAVPGDGDRSPRERGLSADAEDVRTVVIEAAMRDERSQIGRWLDDGAEPPTGFDRGSTA